MSRTKGEAVYTQVIQFAPDARAVSECDGAGITEIFEEKSINRISIGKRKKSVNLQEKMINSDVVELVLYPCYNKVS